MRLRARNTHTHTHSRTHSQEEDVSRLLHSLACAKYAILLKEPAGRSIAKGDRFRCEEAEHSCKWGGGLCEGGVLQRRAPNAFYTLHLLCLTFKFDLFAFTLLRHTGFLSEQG
jgi:hypothetical protein